MRPDTGDVCIGTAVLGGGDHDPHLSVVPVLVALAPLTGVAGGGAQRAPSARTTAAGVLASTRRSARIDQCCG